MKRTLVVSDLHSGIDHLRREVRPDDSLLLLGDLINIIDYFTLDGVLVEMFGVEAVKEVIALRAQGRLDEARLVMAKRREGREEELSVRFAELVASEYAKVFAAIPADTYLILGNVDSPPIVNACIPEHVKLPDGEVVEIQGWKVGFVGGGLPTPLRVAGEIPEEEFDAKLWGLGPADIICAHVPPDVDVLTYDTKAERKERGSKALLEYIERFQPRKVFFGHIHQPLISSFHIGQTHCVNVGYFRKTGRAVELAPNL